MESSPFDEQDVLELVHSIINDNPFIERDAEYQQRRLLLQCQRPVKIPGVTVDAQGKDLGVLQFRSPEIAQDANAYKNTILASRVKINVAAIKDGPKAEDAARRQESFFYRHYYRWRDQRVFDSALFDMAALGVGWLHLMINTELLPLVPDYEKGMKVTDYLENAKGQLDEFTSGEEKDLFVLEHADPSTMRWTPDRSVIVQAAVVPINQLAQLYARRGKKLEYDDKTGVASVTTLDPGENPMFPMTYWARTATLYTVETEDYCYHVMMKRGQTSKDSPVGNVIGVYKNFFGKPAYVPVVGEQTSSPHPLHQYLPLLHGKYQTVPYKNILLTATLAGGVDASQTRYTLEPLPGFDASQASGDIAVTLTAEGVIVPPAGYRMVAVNMPIGQDLGKAMATIQQIDTFGYPKMMRPEEASGMAGYAIAREQDTVAALMNPPIDHFAAALEDVFGMIGHAVKEIGVPITVRNVATKPTENMPANVIREVTLKPEDLDDDTDIQIDFNSISIFTRIAMQEEALKMQQADQFTETQMQMDVMGVDDMEAWRYQRALDKVKKAAEDRAVAAVNATIDKVGAQLEQKALQDAGIGPPVSVDTPPIGQTNGQQLRSDRGGSLPIGLPGQATPIMPTAPPGMGMPPGAPQMPVAPPMGAPQ
jgi:hypothetical protein